LDQIFNSPINTDARKKGHQSQEEQKYQWFLKEQAIIEDTSQFIEPLDIDLESKEKCHQDRQWDYIKEEKHPSPCPLALSLEGKEKREMKKEQGSKNQSYKDHLHPKDRIDWIDATNHDEFAHIPGGEGKDKACNEPMSHIFGIAGKNDETKGKVHRKGKRSRECQDIHRSAFLSNLPIPALVKGGERGD
jgi:hypothetical protein